MKIQQWGLADVHPYPGNPRILGRAVEEVADSIRRFGFLQPIVVDAAGEIIVGHARREAALLLGMEKVPVVVAKDLTEEQARAYRLKDNKAAQFAQWDDDKLLAELKALSAGIDLEATGFSADELLALDMEAQSMLASAEAEMSSRAPAGTDATAGDADELDDGEDLGGNDHDDGELDGEGEQAPLQLVTFSAVMTPEQRDRVFAAVEEAKRRFSADQTGEALWALCNEWVS